MANFIKQFILLFSVQLMIVENGWIVEDISGRRYLVNFNGSPFSRKYAHRLRALNLKQIYYKNERSRKTSTASRTAGVRATVVARKRK